MSYESAPAIAPRFGTTSVVAKMLGVSQRTAQRLAREGRLGPPAAVSVGRWPRWNLAIVERIATNGIEGGAA